MEDIDQPAAEAVSLDAAASALAFAEGVVANLPTALAEVAMRQADAVRAHAAWLADKGHDVLFVGPVGVGKSLAVSAFTGLVLPPSAGQRQAGPAARAVLQVSAGRTTPCPVAVEGAATTSVEVVPLAPDELASRVRDLAHEAWCASRPDEPQPPTGLLPEESARMLRNMAGLTLRGLADLADAEPDAAVLADVVLRRIDVPARGRTLLAHDGPGDEALAWLKATLASVCSGRSDGVPAPARVLVRSPAVLSSGPCGDVRVIDTKGSDHGAIRGEVHDGLHDDRAAVLVCSGFAAMPDEACRAVLAHARDVCGTLGDGRVMVLALERPGEAEDVLDEAGDAVPDGIAGRAVKLAQARRVLDDAYPGTRLPLAAFDAGAEPPDALRARVGAMLASMRERRRLSLDRAVADLSWLTGDGAAAYLAELGSVLAEVGDQARRVALFDGALPGVVDADPFREETKRYASVVWATSRRNGSYDAFDVHRNMADRYASVALARAQAMRAAHEARFAARATDGNPTVAAVMRRISAEVAEMPRLLGRRVHEGVTAALAASLGADAAMWGECAGSWGHAEERDGPYIAFVAGNVGGWLKDRAGDLDAATRRDVDAAWREVVAVPLAEASTGAAVSQGMIPADARPSVPRQDFTDTLDWLDLGFDDAGADGPRPDTAHPSPLPDSPDRDIPPGIPSEEREGMMIADILANLIDEGLPIPRRSRGHGIHPDDEQAFISGILANIDREDGAFLEPQAMPDPRRPELYAETLRGILDTHARVTAFIGATLPLGDACRACPPAHSGQALLERLSRLTSLDGDCVAHLPGTVETGFGTAELSWHPSGGGMQAVAAIRAAGEVVVACWAADSAPGRIGITRVSSLTPRTGGVRNMSADGFPPYLEVLPSALDEALCREARIVADAYLALRPPGPDLAVPDEWTEYERFARIELDAAGLSFPAALHGDGRVHVHRKRVSADTGGVSLPVTVQGSVARDPAKRDLRVKAQGRKPAPGSQQDAAVQAIWRSLTEAGFAALATDPVVAETLAAARDLEALRSRFRACLSNLAMGRRLQRLGHEIDRRLADIMHPAHEDA